MLLQIERTDSPRGFRLVGELDASNAGQLWDAITPELDQAGNLTLDLTGLAFMDSSGIQVLVNTAQGLADHGTLILVSPGPLVRRLLDLIPVERLDNVRIEGEE
jgi:stage II sporulation protein AA (anti-sigma F factor antagonist)